MLQPMTEEAFHDYIVKGGQVDANDWMPEGYRNTVRKFVSFQALAEVVGAAMMAEWAVRAPSLLRKMMYTAKAQDEIGHGHILIRVCEDLGLSRERILEDFIAGHATLLNMFHYEYFHFEEMVVSMSMGNFGAVVQFQSLVRGSYLPYVRALKKILKEESFHYNLGIDMVKWIMEHGTVKEKIRLEEALQLWFPRMLTYFGPSDSNSDKFNAGMHWRIKVDYNDTIRQQWLNKMVPFFQGLGLDFADSNLRKDEATGLWHYTEPDWEANAKMLREGGPALKKWQDLVAKNYEATRWVREVVDRYNVASRSA